MSTTPGQEKTTESYGLVLAILITSKISNPILSARIFISFINPIFTDLYIFSKSLKILQSQSFTFNVLLNDFLKV